MRHLDWGHHYLMCPPDHFTVEYAINPWMTPDDPVNHDLAHQQWQGIVDAITEAGGRVSTIEPDPTQPDMVFTANAGVVADGRFVPARMRFPERELEPKLAGEWARVHGFDVTELDIGTFEGMGDALPFRGQLIAGYGQRSNTVAWNEIQRRFGWPVLVFELPDPRFYHIDLVFSPLSDRTAIVAPIGLTGEGRELIGKVVDDPIFLTDEEATSFSANSIVVGDTVISPAASPRLVGELETRGFRSVVTPVSEFLKAGGAVRCLTLPLDTNLSSDLAQTA